MDYIYPFLKSLDRTDKENGVYVMYLDQFLSLGNI